MLNADEGILADGGVCLSICWTALLIWVKCTVINDASGQTSQRRYFTLEEKKNKGRSKPGMEKRFTGLGFELHADIN